MRLRLRVEHGGRVYGTNVRGSYVHQNAKRGPPKKFSSRVEQIFAQAGNVDLLLLGAYCIPSFGYRPALLPLNH